MNNKGFTLLEVSLFLGISAALGVIAIIGLGPRLRNVRFTQSVRALETSIDSQFQLSSQGQSAKPEGVSCSIGSSGSPVVRLVSTGAQVAGTSDDCISSGRVLFLKTNSAVFYPVISRRVALASASGCDQVDDLNKAVECFKPVMTGAGRIEVNYTNGLELDSLQDGYGVIQNPAGSDRYSFFVVAGEEPSGEESNISISPSSKESQDVCMAMGSRRAKFSYSVLGVRPKVEINGC